MLQEEILRTITSAILSLLVLALAAAGGAPSALAHPHVWVTVETTDCL